MGFLGAGAPLSWEGTARYRDVVKRRGVREFLQLHKQYSADVCPMSTLSWGDEVEYCLLNLDVDNKVARLYLGAEGVLRDLKTREDIVAGECLSHRGSDSSTNTPVKACEESASPAVASVGAALHEEPSHGSAFPRSSRPAAGKPTHIVSPFSGPLSTAAEREPDAAAGGTAAVRTRLPWQTSSWHPEYGTHMIEAIPGTVYPLRLDSILDLLPSMQMRRKKVQEMLPPGCYVASLGSFPTMGAPEYRAHPHCYCLCSSPSFSRPQATRREDSSAGGNVTVRADGDDPGPEVCKNTRSLVQARETSSADLIGATRHCSAAGVSAVADASATADSPAPADAPLAAAESPLAAVDSLAAADSVASGVGCLRREKTDEERKKSATGLSVVTTPMVMPYASRDEKVSNSSGNFAFSNETISQKYPISDAGGRSVFVTKENDEDAPYKKEKNDVFQQAWQALQGQGGVKVVEDREEQAGGCVRYLQATNTRSADGTERRRTAAATAAAAAAHKSHLSFLSLVGVTAHTGDFAYPAAVPDPIRSRSRSLFIGDALINPHPRFGTLTANIRERRGKKVEILIPLFVDERTAVPPIYKSVTRTVVESYLPATALTARESSLRSAFAAANNAGMANGQHVTAAGGAEAAEMRDIRGQEGREVGEEVGDAGNKAKAAAAAGINGVITKAAEVGGREGLLHDVADGVFKDCPTSCAACETYPEDDLYRQLMLEGKILHDGRFIYMDAMGFGMGMHCVQGTFGCPSMRDARYLYDQLAIVAPLWLSLSAATPFMRGLLAAVDSRWDVIAACVDCRTDTEKHYLPKSRYGSVSLYIGEEAPLTQHLSFYNDVPAPVNERAFAALIENGVDEILARHLAFLFIRDPLVIFKDKLLAPTLRSIRKNSKAKTGAPSLSSSSSPSSSSSSASSSSSFSVSSSSSSSLPPPNTCPGSTRTTTSTCCRATCCASAAHNSNTSPAAAALSRRRASAVMDESFEILKIRPTLSTILSHPSTTANAYPHLTSLQRQQQKQQQQKQQQQKQQQQKQQQQQKPQDQEEEKDQVVHVELEEGKEVEDECDALVLAEAAASWGIDDGIVYTTTEDFENLQSTNWNSVRFKPLTAFKPTVAAAETPQGVAETRMREQNSFLSEQGSSSNKSRNSLRRSNNSRKWSSGNDMGDRTKRFISKDSEMIADCRSVIDGSGKARAEERKSDVDDLEQQHVELRRGKSQEIISAMNIFDIADSAALGEECADGNLYPALDAAGEAEADERMATATAARGKGERKRHSLCIAKPKAQARNKDMLPPDKSLHRTPLTNAPRQACRSFSSSSSASLGPSLMISSPSLPTLPSATTAATDDCTAAPWRVEFRTPDVQLTDFENAACLSLISVLVQVILEERLDLYLPMSLNDENMRRAVECNSLLRQKFWFRNDIRQGTADRSIAEFSLHQILFGSHSSSRISGGITSSLLPIQTQIDSSSYTRPSSTSKSPSMFERRTRSICPSSAASSFVYSPFLSPISNASAYYPQMPSFYSSPICCTHTVSPIPAPPSPPPPQREQQSAVSPSVVSSSSAGCLPILSSSSQTPLNVSPQPSPSPLPHTYDTGSTELRNYSCVTFTAAPHSASASSAASVRAPVPACVPVADTCAASFPSTSVPHSSSAVGTSSCAASSPSVPSGISSSSSSPSSLPSSPISSFVGMVPISLRYIEKQLIAGRCSCEAAAQYLEYFDYLRHRTEGILPTDASFLRACLAVHPAYKQDSIIPTSSCFDICRLAIKVGHGECQVAELFGPFAERACMRISGENCSFDNGVPVVTSFFLSHYVSDVFKDMLRGYFKEAPGGYKQHEREQLCPCRRWAETDSRSAGGIGGVGCVLRRQAAAETDETKNRAAAQTKRDVIIAAAPGRQGDKIQAMKSQAESSTYTREEIRGQAQAGRDETKEENPLLPTKSRKNSDSCSQSVDEPPLGGQQLSSQSSKPQTGGYKIIAGDTAATTSTYSTSCIRGDAGLCKGELGHRQSVTTVPGNVISSQNSRDSRDTEKTTERSSSSYGAAESVKQLETGEDDADQNPHKNVSKKDYENEEGREGTVETLSDSWVNTVCRKHDVGAVSVPKENDAVDSVNVSPGSALVAKEENGAEWNAAETVAAAETAGTPGRLQGVECKASATAACKTLPCLTTRRSCLGEAGGSCNRLLFREKADRKIAFALSGKVAASLCSVDVANRLRSYMLEPYCLGDTCTDCSAPAVTSGVNNWSCSSMYNGGWPACCGSVGVTNEEATGMWIFLTSGLNYSRSCDESGSTSCPSTEDDRESADEACSIPRLLFSSGEVMAYSKAVLDASA